MAVMTYLQAISSALRDELRADERVLVMGEDIGVFGGAFKVTDGFVAEFGSDRVMDTPLAESAIIGCAVGAAVVGMRPVCEMQFADFVSCGFDQLVNVAGKMHYRQGLAVPLVVRLPSGGGFSGGPFHSQNPEALFMHSPGIKVVAPSTAADAKGLLHAAIHDPNPVCFMEHKHLYRRVKGEVPDGIYETPFRASSVTGRWSRWRWRRPRISTARRSRCSTCARWSRSTSRRSSMRWSAARRW
jgi:pyruvate/2-oxoglutarate/acetoin dehydrogenase E1 component